MTTTGYVAMGTECYDVGHIEAHKTRVQHIVHAQHIARLFRCWFSTMWCTAATVAAPAAMATTQRAADPITSMLALAV
jgi:hypothetical protein